MSKKHPERAQRRRQARAERHRRDCKRRRAAERAQRIGVPRKEHPSVTYEMAYEQELRDILRQLQPRQGTVSIHIPGPTSEPPPAHVVEAFRAALDEVVAGGGEILLEGAEWEPAEDEDEDSFIWIALRLFGQVAEFRGSVYPIDRGPFEGHDELDLRAAEQALVLLRQDKLCAAAATLLYAIEELLIDYLRLDAPRVASVLRRLAIPHDLADVLEPIARALPEEERRAWYAARDEGRWHERIGEAVFHSLFWELSGPLVDFGEWIAAAAGDGWTPPWTTSSARR